MIRHDFGLGGGPQTNRPNCLIGVCPVRLSLDGVSEWKVPFPIASTEPDAWNIGYLRILIWLLGGGVKDLDNGAEEKLRSGVRKPGSVVNRSTMNGNNTFNESN